MRGPGAPDGDRGAPAARERLLDVFEDLLAHGDTPSLGQVAAVTGLSQPAVLEHFGDVDLLADAVVERVLARLAPDTVGVPADGPLEHRVERFVELRTRFCEHLGPLRRAIPVYEPRVDPVRRRVRAARRRFHGELTATFAPELAMLPTEERRGLLAALDTSLSWETWEQLRGVHRLGVRQSRRVVARMVLAVLRDALHEAG